MQKMPLNCGCELELTADLADQFETLVMCKGGGKYTALVDEERPETGTMVMTCKGGKTYVLTRLVVTTVQYEVRPITMVAKSG